MIALRLGLALCLVSSGCATMVNGRSQTLRVDSSPSGASVEVACADSPKIVATTPAKIDVPRAAEFCRLTLTREGYEPKVVELSHQPSRATILNAGLGIPSAILLGAVGAIAGSAVNGAETGAELGAQTGYEAGRAGATELDKKGGGWKWVPGDIYVVLPRSAPSR